MDPHRTHRLGRQTQIHNKREGKKLMEKEKLQQRKKTRPHFSLSLQRFLKTQWPRQRLPVGGLNCAECVGISLRQCHNHDLILPAGSGFSDFDGFYARLCASLWDMKDFAPPSLGETKQWKCHRHGGEDAHLSRGITFDNLQTG